MLRERLHLCGRPLEARADKHGRRDTAREGLRKKGDEERVKDVGEGGMWEKRKGRGEGEWLGGGCGGRLHLRLPRLFGSAPTQDRQSFLECEYHSRKR